MKPKTLQIVWHSKDPVFSVDFHPSSYTLVTGGADGEIKFWEVSTDEQGSPTVSFLSSSGVQNKSVNCVRISPLGDTLATAGDKGEVLLWRLSDAPRGNLEGDGAGPAWRRISELRGHSDDVQDLAWSPDGTACVTGSIENEVILWDVGTRKPALRLREHSHYVQGVAWDPLGLYVASQSCDRTCKVYSVKPPAQGSQAAKQYAAGVTSALLAKDYTTAASIIRRSVPTSALTTGTAHAAGASAAAAGTTGVAAGAAAVCTAAGAGGAGGAGVVGSRKEPLFHDDQLGSFFRRLAWSPDGSFLACPSGLYKATADSPAINATYLFSRGQWNGPAASLPCMQKGALVVRFCPTIFKLRGQCSQRQATGGGAATAAGGGGGGPQAALGDQQQPPPAAAAGVAPAGDAGHTAATTAAVEAHMAGAGNTGQQQQPAGPEPFRLPYRLLFAVATSDSVLLYDTQSPEPLAVLGGLHCATVTDLAWSHDGRYLAVSSRDAYCSLVAFSADELGEPAALEELPPQVAAAVSRAAAKRQQQRAAAAAAVAAAKRSAAAAAAGAAPAPPAAAPQLLQRQQSGEGQAAPPGPASGTKRPLEAGTAALNAPKPKRIQPVPLAMAATAATATLQAPTSTGMGMTAPAPVPAAAAPIAPVTGPRRIQPIMISSGGAAGASCTPPAASAGAGGGSGGGGSAPSNTAGAPASGAGSAQGAAHATPVPVSTTAAAAQPQQAQPRRITPISVLPTPLPAQTVVTPAASPMPSASPAAVEPPELPPLPAAGQTHTQGAQQQSGSEAASVPACSHGQGTSARCAAEEGAAVHKQAAGGVLGCASDVGDAGAMQGGSAGVALQGRQHEAADDSKAVCSADVPHGSCSVGDGVTEAGGAGAVGAVQQSNEQQQHQGPAPTAGISIAMLAARAGAAAAAATTQRI